VGAKHQQRLWLVTVAFWRSCPECHAGQKQQKAQKVLRVRQPQA